MTSRRGRVLGDTEHTEEGHGGSSAETEGIMRAESSRDVPKEDVEHGKRDGEATGAEAGVTLKTTNATEEIIDTAEPGLGETEKGIAEPREEPDCQTWVMARLSVWKTMCWSR